MPLVLVVVVVEAAICARVCACVGLFVRDGKIVMGILSIYVCCFECMKVNQLCASPFTWPICYVRRFHLLSHSHLPMDENPFLTQYFTNAVKCTKMHRCHNAIIIIGRNWFHFSFCANIVNEYFFSSSFFLNEARQHRSRFRTVSADWFVERTRRLCCHRTVRVWVRQFLLWIVFAKWPTADKIYFWFSFTWLLNLLDESKHKIWSSTIFKRTQWIHSSAASSRRNLTVAKVVSNKR